MDLCLPPDDRFYSSRKIFITAVNQHAADQGYAVITKRSKKTKDGEVRKIWLSCDKGSKYISKGYGKRLSSTRLTECPFELIAHRNPETSQWNLTIKNSEHNHPATLAGAHTVHRKAARTEEIQNTIAVQTRINSSAKQILSAI